MGQIQAGEAPTYTGVDSLRCGFHEASRALWVSERESKYQEIKGKAQMFSVKSGWLTVEAEKLRSIVDIWCARPGHKDCIQVISFNSE